MKESESQKPNPNCLWVTVQLTALLLPTMPDDICGSSNQFTPCICPFKPMKGADKGNWTKCIPTLTTAPAYSQQRLSFPFAERHSGFLTARYYLLKSNVRIPKPVMLLLVVTPRDPTALQICHNDLNHQAFGQKWIILRDTALTKTDDKTRNQTGKYVHQQADPKRCLSAALLLLGLLKCQDMLGALQIFQVQFAASYASKGKCIAMCSELWEIGYICHREAEMETNTLVQGGQSQWVIMSAPQMDPPLPREHYCYAPQKHALSTGKIQSNGN